MVLFKTVKKSSNVDDNWRLSAGFKATCYEASVRPGPLRLGPSGPRVFKFRWVLFRDETTALQQARGPATEEVSKPPLLNDLQTCRSRSEFRLILNVGYLSWQATLPAARMAGNFNQPGTQTMFQLAPRTLCNHIKYSCFMAKLNRVFKPRRWRFE